MNKGFYERCKKVVSNLELTYEQGIARDVILNELDMLEKQEKDYQTRFVKAIEYIKPYRVIDEKYWIEFTIENKIELLEILGDKE